MPIGQISPTTALHVAQSLPNESFLILDGGRCNVGIESSIIQATHHDRYTVLRPGMIDLKTMKVRLAKECPLHVSSPRVSGQLDSHYKPQKMLYYIDDWQQFDNYLHLLIGETYTISISEYTPEEGTLHHQLPNDEQVVAYHLLRHAHRSQADVIIIELPQNQIKWCAIREKLSKRDNQ